jgi:hypothetical protein
MLGYPAVEARDALKQWAILKKINDSKSNLFFNKNIYNFLQSSKRKQNLVTVSLCIYKQINKYLI